MRLRRAIAWGAASTASVVLIAAGLLALAVKRVPADYRPLTLSADQRDRAVERLYRAIMDFQAVAGNIGIPPRNPTKPQPREGTVEVTADDLNRWIALMPAEGATALRQIGLRDPAVAVNDGRLTLFAHWERFNAIISVDLALVFGADQRMRIEVRRARLGALPVPDKVVAKHRRQIIDQLRDHVRGLGETRGKRFGPLSMNELARAATQLIDPLDNTPVRLDLPRRHGQARVSNIRLAEDKVVVKLVSLLPEPPIDHPVGSALKN